MNGVISSKGALYIMHGHSIKFYRPYLLFRRGKLRSGEYVKLSISWLCKENIYLAMMGNLSWVCCIDRYLLRFIDWFLHSHQLGTWGDISSSRRLAKSTSLTSWGNIYCQLVMRAFLIT